MDAFSRKKGYLKAPPPAKRPRQTATDSDIKMSQAKSIADIAFEPVLEPTNTASRLPHGKRTSLIDTTDAACDDEEYDEPDERILNQNSIGMSVHDEESVEDDEDEDKEEEDEGFDLPVDIEHASAVW